MASIVPNRKRGTWQVQWHDGKKWARVTVTRKRKGWKPSDGLPKKPPLEVAEALAAYQKREDALRSSRSTAPERTVAEFLNGYAEGYGVGHRPRSAEQVRFAVDRFLIFCASIKVTRLDSVTPEVIDGYLDARAAGKLKGRCRRKGGGAAHNTLRKEAGLLSGAWGKAVKLRRLHENPWAKATIPGKLARGSKSSWTPDEFARLAAACRPWLRALVTLGVNTGLRASALTRIEWRDVRFSPAGEDTFGKVVVRPELDKAGVGYSVPLSTACYEALRALATGGPGSARVLKGQGGGPVESVSHVGTAIHSACERAGLPRPDSPCHAMRRTFGRWAVLGHLTGQPVPLYVVQRWMGHANLQMTMRYLDVHEDDSQNWMRQVSPP